VDSTESVKTIDTKNPIISDDDKSNTTNSSSIVLLIIAVIIFFAISIGFLIYKKKLDINGIGKTNKVQAGNENSEDNSGSISIVINKNGDSNNYDNNNNNNNNITTNNNGQFTSISDDCKYLNRMIMKELSYDCCSNSGVVCVNNRITEM